MGKIPFFFFHYLGNIKKTKKKKGKGKKGLNLLL